MTVFHAGTAEAGANVVTSGGRVLGVTGVDADLQAALARAYDGVSALDFDGAFHRNDIGHRALARTRK